MEPQVRYVTSSDGTRIATWRLGKGTPLILVRPIWSLPTALHWLSPSDRGHLERLAGKRTVIMYDNRGQGLSDREAGDLSLEARTADLAAVVQSLGVRPFDLMAMANSAPVAIAYAADNPDRVRCLVLSSAAARGRDIRLSPQRHAIARLAEVDWALFNRVGALISYGFTEFAELVAETGAASITPETFLRATKAAWQFDATGGVSKVACPTLVLHQERGEVPIEVSRQLAASLPDGRLVVYDQPFSSTLGTTETVDNIEAFLDEGDPGAAAPAEALPSGTAIILFTDIADSTALTEKMGDAAFRETAHDLDERMRSAIREAGGKPVEGKVLGDGVMALFTSAAQAIEAAVRCRDAGSHSEMPIHVGVHAGDVIRDGNTVYGGAVNVASRVCGLSATGEVLVSETVRSLARTSAGVRFEDRGEHELKGVGEAVRVWAVVQNQ